MARQRNLALAKLGFTWVKAKAPATEAECLALLGVKDTEAEPLRGEMVRHVRGVLAKSPLFQPAWVLELLDSRHEEVRAEGWAWFLDEPRARDSGPLWQRLLESPYDDVRLKLVATLEARVAAGDRALAEEGGLDPEAVRFLWATVLLNVHRGSKTKPVVIRQLLRRVERHPGEAAALLPILSVALRSARGPEFRSGLHGVVQIVGKDPSLEAAVAQAFPELQLQPTA
jgi:hypothetical protein